MLAAGDPGRVLLGVAEVITAAGGLVGALAAFVGAVKRKGLSARPKTPDADDPEAVELWLDALEQLDDARAENERLRRRLQGRRRGRQ